MSGRGAPTDKVTRDPPPCYGCTEKFTACHDRCPKDERGEFGYKAWKAKIAQQNAERKKHNERTRGIKYY